MKLNIPSSEYPFFKSVLSEGVDYIRNLHWGHLTKEEQEMIGKITALIWLPEHCEYIASEGGKMIFKVKRDAEKRGDVVELYLKRGNEKGTVVLCCKNPGGGEQCLMEFRDGAFVRCRFVSIDGIKKDEECRIIEDY